MWVALDHLSAKWSVLVVRALAQGGQRFNSLRRAVPGISDRLLSVTLRRLQRDGLVARDVLGHRAPAVRYTLTPMGFSFAQLIESVARWSAHHRAAIESARSEYGSETLPHA